MMENDNDKLLTSFFAEHRKEIADNGFSRRVLRQLPNRSQRLSLVWNIFCVTLALVLLITLDGLQATLNTLREAFQAVVQCGAAELDYESLAIAAMVLLYFAYHKISSLA
ncbi:DUF5056 domain-containing protein [Bacteroides zoogleoformans]|uniref:DUF5056 domain-containing protein n=1 Tax=Bacteroides zoogleoformans TaxID=28119 RepID=UPI00248EF127|nr:DUF5056 domain-containing protein [Bacteroides zoogleoformans]